MTTRTPIVFSQKFRSLLRNARFSIQAGFRYAARVFGRDEPGIFALGDSHAIANFDAAPEFRVRYLGPMTMHRIARDGREAVSLKGLGVFQGDTLIWGLGEIDVRCHLVNQRDLQGATVASLADSLARGYVRSIAAIQEEIGGLTTVVLAVIPPSDQGEDADFPKAGTLRERIEARNLLNAALEKYSGSQGFRYFDPYVSFLDQAGALNPKMSDGNVHCGPEYAPIIARRVLELCSALRGGSGG